MECQGDKCSELHRCASGGCTCLRLAALGVEIIETENIARRYRGWYDPETQSVVVRADLPWPKKHSTLAHELAHVELGDAHRPTWWGAVREDDMEADANELAARDLIPLWRLAGVLQDAQAAEDAAAQLDVDARMVRARLASLTAVERRFLDHATQPLARRRVTLERMPGRVVLADQETDQPATRLRDVQMTARRILADL